jgi:hypothetical protein
MVSIVTRKVGHTVEMRQAFRREELYDRTSSIYFNCYFKEVAAAFIES